MCLLQLGNANEDVIAESTARLCQEFGIMGLELPHKLRFGKTILLWMFQKDTVTPAIQGVTRDFFEEEFAGRFEHSTKFCDGRLPGGHVMQDSEIKYRIKEFVGKRKPVRTRHCERDTTGVTRNEFVAGKVDLPWIEINAGDVRCSELLQQNAYTHSLPTTDFEHLCSIKPTAQTA